MALIKCPECGKDNISSTADTCPACGYNFKKKKRRIKWVIILVFVLVLFGILFIRGAIANNKQQQIETLQESALDSYYNGNYTECEEYCDSLEALNYDTSYIRDMIAYDNENYQNAEDFHMALQNLHNRLDVSFLQEDDMFNALNEFSDLFLEFDSTFRTIEQKDSNVGMYVWKIQNSGAYNNFSSDYLVRRVDVSYNNHQENAYRILNIIDDWLSLELPNIEQ